MSKHHDEAAVMVQHKLQRMQENLGPFLHSERDTVQAGGSSSSVAAPRRPGMTSVFASRVPTGRIPDSRSQLLHAPPSTVCAGGGRKPGAARKAAGPASPQHRPGSFVLCEEDDSTDACGREPRANVHAAANAWDSKLEAEIEEFYATRQRDPAAKTPKYRVLRRARSPETASAAATATPSTQSHGLSTASPLPEEPSPGDFQSPPQQDSGVRGRGSADGDVIDSDSELDEIEGDARRLEAQLAWWRQRGAVAFAGGAGMLGANGPISEESSTEFHPGVGAGGGAGGFGRRVECSEAHAAMLAGGEEEEACSGRVRRDSAVSSSWAGSVAVELTGCSEWLSCPDAAMIVPSSAQDEAALPDVREQCHLMEPPLPITSTGSIAEEVSKQAAEFETGLTSTCAQQAGKVALGHPSVVFEQRFPPQSARSPESGRGSLDSGPRPGRGDRHDEAAAWARPCSLEDAEGTGADRDSAGTSADGMLPARHWRALFADHAESSSGSTLRPASPPRAPAQAGAWSRAAASSHPALADGQGIGAGREEEGTPADGMVPSKHWQTLFADHAESTPPPTAAAQAGGCFHAAASSHSAFLDVPGSRSAAPQMTRTAGPGRSGGSALAASASVLAAMREWAEDLSKGEELIRQHEAGGSPPATSGPAAVGDGQEKAWLKPGVTQNPWTQSDSRKRAEEVPSLSHESVGALAQQQAGQRQASPAAGEWQQPALGLDIRGFDELFNL